MKSPFFFFKIWFSLIQNERLGKSLKFLSNYSTKNNFDNEKKIRKRKILIFKINYGQQKTHLYWLLNDISNLLFKISGENLMIVSSSFLKSSTFLWLTQI